MSTACVQDIYKCATCKSAADEHGRGCKYGLLFPLLLVITEQSNCNNYEFDMEKARLQLKKLEESKT